MSVNRLHVRAQTGVLDFLTGGGQMAEAIADKDWSKTALGPLESWPQSLRTTVSLCLASTFPIALIWGNERIQLYNDGYVPICAAKHPDSLGQDFRECWASAWPAIGEAFESAEDGKTRFLENQRTFVDRNGYLEESFFTFSFSPVRDESGEVGGLFHPVTETTAIILSQRRTQVLRQLAAQAAQAAAVEEACASAFDVLRGAALDVPFAVLYLMDESGNELQLQGSCGVEQHAEAMPCSIGLDQSESPWPFRKVIDSAQPDIVEHFAERLGMLSCGPYPDLPSKALVLPIPPSGLHRQGGVFVAGVSARLPLDEDYRAFYDLLAAQLATGIGNARASQEEREQAEALAELDRAKTQFFSNVSHEFRTPLTLMLGPLQQILDRGDQSSDGGDQLAGVSRDEVDLVYRNGLRLLRLVNTLLDFSRVEAGRETALFKPVDLALLTAEAASLFRSATEQVGLQLLVDCPVLSKPVYVDRSMWEKIILNLISNAFKFTFAGAISVALREHHSTVVLSVSDTGTGIPEAARSRLFERFYRVEGARGRTHEGTGIGLSLVREMVKLHGGTVHVESELGRGSTFAVTLPLGSDHLPPDQTSVSCSERVSSSPQTDIKPLVAEALRWRPQTEGAGRQLPAERRPRARTLQHRARILLVDDNADMRQYVERLLDFDYEVQPVADGAEALRTAREDPPDLVLSDVMMPELDGIGLLSALRQDERTQGIPIILLSARAGEEARVEGLQAGADDYLVKPFGAKELLARVRANLELSHLRLRLSREAETRRSAAAIERQRRLFDTALSNSPDSIYLFDLGGRFTYVNRPLLSLWQKPLEAAVGRDFFDLGYPPEVAEKLQGQIQEVIATRQSVRDETLFTGPTGETRRYEYIFVPVFREDGQVEAVAGSTRDVTDHHAAEEALRQTEHRLARALEAGELGVWELDLVTKELWRSLRHDQIFGYEALVPGWTYAVFLEHVVPEDRAEVMERFDRSVLQGGSWEQECRINRADGSQRWIWAHGKVELGESGDAVRMKGMVRDITERKSAEEDLRRSNQELARTNSELEEFAYVASHDLQEPLRMVNIFTQKLVRQFGDKGPEAQKFAQYIHDGVSRMEELIRGLLRFSSTVSIGSSTPKGEANLSVSLSEALQILHGRIEEAHATITADPLPRVEADEGQLAHVFQNLLANSLKYSQADQPPQIHISAHLRNDFWVISARDNGIGFDQGHSERIFGLFKRLHKDAYPGTGIGLAICKRIIERYGGQMSAESSPGAGATFYFTLRPAHGEA